MNPEGTRDDAPPTVVDMSLSAIHGSTNGSGRKDSACGQDFQITLCVARRVPPGPEPFAGTRKPGVQPKAPDRASRAPESEQKRTRRSIYPSTVRKPPHPSPHRATFFCPRRSPPSIRILALSPAPATRFARAGRHPNPFRPEMSENQRPNEKISAPHFAQSPFFVIFAPALSLINF